MNLQQLEYFKVIAETKNFTVSSNILSVTQPALSKAISKLEKELDVKLFERDGRNIKITEFGNEFLKYAENALNEIDRGKDRLREMKSSEDRTISISSTYCIGSTFIPFLISSFFNTKIRLKFNINNQSPADMLKDINNKKIDFGFMAYHEEISRYPEIESVLVRKEEYVLIVPKNHSLANKEEVWLKDLEDEYFIVYNDKACDKKISYSEFIGYTPKISAEPTEAAVLSGLVAAGAGIAIIINTPILDTSRLSVIKIKDDIGYKNIYMAWNKNAYMNNAKKEFKEYALKLI